MFLTITGKLGSGKSTICRLFAEKYGFEIYSTGKVQRKIANDMGISTLRLNELMRTDKKYDDLIDQETVRISRERKDDNIIFDSRMAFHFAESGYHIFTTIDPAEAARRVMLSPRGEEEFYPDEETAHCKLLERSRVENIRFQELYAVDNLDYANYHLILDTTWASPEELADVIYHAISGKMSKRQALFSPKSLYPTKRVEETPETKEEGDGSVKIACFAHYHYILKGHAKVRAALAKGTQFIAAAPVDKKEYEDEKKQRELLAHIAHAGADTLCAYETLGNFCYKSRPAYYSSGCPLP